MSSRTALSIDGQAVATPLARVQTLPEPSVTYELNECKRKLEKRESDLKRKERESSGFQSELVKSQKEFKSARAELSSIRERNEQLQHSLTTARETIATQETKLRDIEDSDLSNDRLKKTETALIAMSDKVKGLENELETLRKAPSTSLDDEVGRLQTLLNLSKFSEDSLKTDVTNLQLASDKVRVGVGVRIRNRCEC
jgi:chromosome segregation ATPase